MRFNGFGRRALIIMSTLGLLWPALGFAKGGSRCEYFYSVHLHPRDYDDLPKAQKEQYSRYKDQYVDLDNTPMPDWLRDEAEETRDWVKDVVGYLPEIERSGFCAFHCMTSKMVLHMWEPGVKHKKSDGQQDGNEIATFTYQIPMDDPYKLISSNTWVDKDYRNYALSELLTVETLALYPFIKRIEVERLEDTNLKLYQQAMDDGLKCKDRIRETYAYKKFERLGFTKIVDWECFNVGKSPEGPFDIPTARFTVERP